MSNLWKKIRAFGAIPQGHPANLKGLGETEREERFAYYTVMAVFTLSLTSSRWKMTEGEASKLYGTFIALIYLAPFFGGMLADQIGYRISIIMGGACMALGYAVMALANWDFFPYLNIKEVLYLGMGLVIVGNGLFKPNISTLVGRLYPQGSDKQDDGYSYFYVCINKGSFWSPIAAAILKLLGFSWAASYAVASIGMVGGVMHFLRYYKKLANAEKPSSLGAVFNMDLPEEYNDRPRHGVARGILAIATCCVIMLLFWAVFHQNGSTTTYWARDNTERAWLKSGADASAVHIVESTLLYSKKGEVISQKITVDHNLPNLQIEDSIAVQTTPLDRAEVEKIEGNTLVVTPPFHGKLYRGQLLYPPNAFWEIPASIYAAINPLFIIFLTPFVTAWFHRLRRRGWHINTPRKIALGMFLTSVSCLILALGAFMGGNNGRVSNFWIGLSTFVITVAELCLSPMGLSMIKKLAPPTLVGMMMGAWFLSTSGGNYLAGELGVDWKIIPHHIFFIKLAAGAFFGCLLMLPNLGWLGRTMPPEKEEEGETKKDRKPAGALQVASTGLA